MSTKRYSFFDTIVSKEKRLLYMTKVILVNVNAKVAHFRIDIYNKIELYGEQAEIDVPEYEVTFNPDNGESSTIQNVMEGGYATLPSSEPTKEGYNFLGWYLEDLEFDFTNTPIIRDVEIKAKWEMIIAEYIEDASVEFSFDNLTSEGTKVSDTYLTDKYTDTLLSDIIISGSVYDGNGSGSTNYANTTGLIKFGTGSATGELKFVFNENVLIKTIIIYAAGWTASEGQLRVNGNNPAGESNLAVIETRYVIVLDETTNEITIGTSSNRAFLFAVGFYGPEAEVPAAPVITEWEVSFDLGYDGSPVMEPVIVEDKKAVNEPSKPSREGYTFKGWLLNGVEYNFTDPVLSDITLLASWEEEEEPSEGTFIETFDAATNLPTGSNYGEGTFTGVENITWSYHGQAAGEYEIDGNGFLLRRASDSYLEATFPNGIKSLSFDYRKAYTGGTARQLEVLINGEVKTTSESFGSGSGEDATVYNLTVEVNVEESVTVRIKLTGIAATNRHAVIDNFTWTTNPS